MKALILVMALASGGLAATVAEDCVRGNCWSSTSETLEDCAGSNCRLGEVRGDDCQGSNCHI